MMEIVEHITRALLRHRDVSDAEVEQRGVSSFEEHRMAHLFMVMHKALHDWVAPCHGCSETPAEMPNNESDAQHGEEPHAEDATDTVDHAESDSVEEHHEEVSSVTSES